MSNEELAVLAQQGDREAIAGLWEQVKRLLYQLARRFYRRYGVECCSQRGVTMEDLEQECYLALLDAVRAYKPAGGWRFTTYLTRAPESRFKAAMGLRKCNPLDIADSMNAPALDDGEHPVEAGDLIPDPQAAGELEAIDITAEREYHHAELEAGLAALEPLQEAGLRGRYYQGKTLRETAEGLSVTLSDVRREVSKGLQALRADERIQRLGDEYIAGNAYKHTSFSAWKYGGSVEEWLVERG
ncbi:sigma-70 family RNA polymerase sigma factor [Acutalibacter sp. 1XD8-33]|uniref:RNA polymerase sigma factor n=1 Tax=Acutalibacter sp. 1XD8-33 TaxID=2320081 RepID=UPI000EA0C849|nr:sigma-70 family RNA polymerase sigma factor [Acutalibacter sp. 1XD8-33]RKJ38170.1 sigma-70 family RNA polymerase sigma factor [Acutalibacter sp. 1XD8-33]